MDYAMAVVLGGCNNVVEPYQINYYLYAIADQSIKKDTKKLGVTWTWSSNVRRTIGWKGSGQLDNDINTSFRNISTDTTINNLIEMFEKMESKEFITKKNSLVITGLQK